MDQRNRGADSGSETKLISRSRASNARSSQRPKSRKKGRMKIFPEIGALLARGMCSKKASSTKASCNPPDRPTDRQIASGHRSVEESSPLPTLPESDRRAYVLRRKRIGEEQKL
ncbi:hypothetical protein RJ55_00450 [Drechmeria coniospora]|nr:hypothetical protein RJ55_00450 [Drechmeria coniospora]